MELDCQHPNTMYQEKEIETNIPESLTCEDCGEELDIPEPELHGNEMARELQARAVGLILLDEKADDFFYAVTVGSQEMPRAIA